MSRPLWNSLWLKLFGPDGVTTVAEFREAILNARLGQIADDGVIARVRSIVSAYVHDPERSNPDGSHEFPIVRLLGPDPSLQLNLRFPAIPGTPLVFGFDPVAGLSAAPAAGANGQGQGPTTPDQVAGNAGDRIVSLQVGLDPVVIENRQPVTCDGTDGLDVRNGYLGGWLESFVRFYQPFERGMPGFEFHHVQPGDLEYWTSVTGPADSRIDTMALSGDFSSGFVLSRTSAVIGDLLLGPNHDYSLATDDDFVGAGARLTIHGDRIGPGGHVIFDGSAESDGSFSFLGSDNGDFFFGGAGDDNIRGLGGADTLTGGGGIDTFVYLAAGDSTGAAYDTLADFDPTQDRIDLPVTVTGLNLPVAGGTLSTASFNADLGAALSHLGVGYAVLYAPDAGDLAGNLFLVVDGNGVAGYQAGEDYVFALPATALADLSAHPNFFI